MNEAATAFVIASVLFWVAVYVGARLKSWRYWLSLVMVILILASRRDPVPVPTETDLWWLYGCNVLMGILVAQIRSLRSVALFKFAHDFRMRRESRKNIVSLSSTSDGGTSESGIARPIANLPDLLESHMAELGRRERGSS